MTSLARCLSFLFVSSSHVVVQRSVVILSIFALAISGAQRDARASEITTGTWTWQAGDSSQDAELLPVYGTQGVADPTNNPGGRDFAARWTNSDGDTWVFGGNGYGANAYGTLNDFWKYDAQSGMWTWLGGSKNPYDSGSYGIQGVASPQNLPPNRFSASTWLDASGDLWMFGGSSKEGEVFGPRNDLWKYDVSAGEWTWIKGSQTIAAPQVDGSLGIPDSANDPGGRLLTISWLGQDGSLWLFGGVGSLYNNKNDIWNFNPNTNNWMRVHAGNSNGQGIYYSKTVEAPAACPTFRSLGSTWVDSKGQLWLYGGQENFVDYEVYGDLWRFNPGTGYWAWMKEESPNKLPIYPPVGDTSSLNYYPGCRYQSSAWIDDDDNLWLFGGYLRSYGFIDRYSNDLWQYDTSTNRWNYIKGPKGAGDSGTMGTIGVPDPANNPPARYRADSWKSTTGTMYLRGGSGESPEGYAVLNDTWSLDTISKNWTWLGGGYEVLPPRATAQYGEKGIASPDVNPGPRNDAVTWRTDDTLWLYGGYNEIQSPKADLWSFNLQSKLWTWVDGTTETNVAAVPGQLGVAAPENTPGGLLKSLSWVDEQGNLWLDGSDGIWKYDLTQQDWACMDVGSTNATPVYGSIGVPDEDNVPGSRNGAATWQDADGNLWMFGGWGRTTGTAYGALNDLWRYEPASEMWTWMSGSTDVNSTGSYGQLKIESPENQPAGRTDAVTWVGNDGTLWLFGGRLANVRIPASDLWRYNINSGNWTWMGGPQEPYEAAVHGEMGVQAPGNTPGARYGSAAWIDAKGDAWLFGGERQPQQPLGDFWKYEVETGLWTWMGGSKDHSEGGIYGTFQVGSADNIPGARSRALTWPFADGSVWLYGGFGMDEIGGYPETRSDMWQFVPSAPAGVGWEMIRLYE